MKKKLLALLFAAATAANAPFVLVGCNSNGNNGNNTDNNGGEHTHSYVNYVPNNDATCEQDGTKTATCEHEGCTEKNTITDEGTAGHKYAEGWDKDDDYHWHAAICDCGQAPLDKITHTFADGATCICGQKYTPTEGLAFELNADGESYKVTGIGTATDTKIVIPSTYENKPVTAIAEMAFCSDEGNITVTSITVPNGVTTIGYGAFAEMYALESAVLPDGLTEIAPMLFLTCEALKSVNIPDSVTAVGAEAFAGCDNLAGNEYENGLYLGNEKNPYHTFVKVKDPTDPHLQMNSKTKIICGESFMRSAVTDLVVPEGVISLSPYAFSSSNLETVTLPSTLKKTGYNVFYQCKVLSEVTLADGITEISEGAFSYCGSLFKIIIPASVKTISDDSFKECGAVVWYCEITEDEYYENEEYDWDKPSGSVNVNNKNITKIWDYQNNNLDVGGYEYALIGGLKYQIKDGYATLSSSQPTGIKEATITKTIEYNGNAYTVQCTREMFKNCTNLKKLTVDVYTKVNYPYNPLDLCSSITDYYYNVTCDEFIAGKLGNLQYFKSVPNRVYKVHCTDGTLINTVYQGFQPEIAN